MSKRGQNEGTISKRPDGTWWARITIGRTPDGKQKRKAFYGQTRAEVQKKMTAAQNALNNGVYVELSKLTVGEWLDTWFKEYVLPTKKPSTARGYDAIIRLYLKPELGHICLKDLNVEHVQALYNKKIQGGLSARTIEHINAMFHKSLEQAKKNSKVAQNVCKAVELPKVEPKQIEFFTIEEQEKFITACSDSKHGVMYEFILATGLRMSELLGLRWKDVDFDNGVICVTQTIMRLSDFDETSTNKTKIYTGTPKSKAGNRVIPLNENMLNKLRLHRKKQLEYKLSIGECWKDSGLVFTSAVGTNLEPRKLSTHFYDILAAAGLEKRGVHSLRHTFATRAVENGVNIKVQSEILGHEDISTTLNLYVHTTTDSKREEMKKLEFLFQ